MNKPIDLRTHGYIDYLLVLVFLLAPFLLTFTGVPAVMSYLAAAVLLAVALLTDYPLGVLKRISLRIHGMIELIAAAVLVILPWVLGFAALAVPRNFFIIMGLLLVVAWLLTDFEQKLDHQVIQ